MKNKEIIEYLQSLVSTYGALQGKTLQVFICGGAGLLALNLIDRSTKDIDLVGPPDLPKEFWKAAEVTAEYFQLPKDWINQGPSSLWDSGLPEGFEKRCVPLKLKGSSSLKFFLTSRLDQIHFKLYATVDQGPSRHLQDLKTLKPTVDELISASKWCLQQDVSENFHSILIDFLKKEGWPDVASKLY